MKTSLGPATILREFGIAALENIPVTVFVVTGGVSHRARAVADEIMRQSNKVVLIFNGENLKTLASDENAIFNMLAKQSEHARDIKSKQVETDVVDELIGEGKES
jgi:restriction endonuclease Mrr